MDGQEHNRRISYYKPTCSSFSEIEILRIIYNMVHFGNSSDLMRKYENLQLRKEVIILLRRRCGFTFKIIGTLYEISASRVAQIYNKALRRERCISKISK